jgi:uncharacterized protein
MDYLEVLEEGKLNQKDYQKTLTRIKKKKNKEVDEAFEDFHEEAFDSIDCLSCANCCKTTSPIFRDIDIKRISKKLRLKEKEFINSYLRLDEEQDYVLKSSPCSFLGVDNKCDIYEDRPLACREYPHTNRKNMYQIFDLTIRNAEICPAVVKVLDQINLKFS